MQTWELIPYKSVGPIFFTDTRNDIIKKLGEPKEISKTGEFLVYDNFLFTISLDSQNIYSISPNAPNKCKILYEGLNLNILDYKKIVTELFRKRHEIYGNFSSFPEYVDKDLGIGFITHESNIDNAIELECLGIWTQEAVPDCSCSDDILITREDQII